MCEPDIRVSVGPTGRLIDVKLKISLSLVREIEGGWSFSCQGKYALASINRQWQERIGWYSSWEFSRTIPTTVKFIPACVRALPAAADAVAVAIATAGRYAFLL